MIIRTQDESAIYDMEKVFSILLVKTMKLWL